MRAFNTAAHAALIAAGYVHERHDADWQDTGDAENGPELSGGPAFDLYTDADSVVMISESGETAFESARSRSRARRRRDGRTDPRLSRSIEAARHRVSSDGESGAQVPLDRQHLLDRQPAGQHSREV